MRSDVKYLYAKVQSKSGKTYYKKIGDNPDYEAPRGISFKTKYEKRTSRTGREYYARARVNPDTSPTIVTKSGKVNEELFDEIFKKLREEEGQRAANEFRKEVRSREGKKLANKYTMKSFRTHFESYSRIEIMFKNTGQNPAEIAERLGIDEEDLLDELNWKEIFEKDEEGNIINKRFVYMRKKLESGEVEYEDVLDFNYETWAYGTIR